jgi:glutamate--cysteine ligase
MPAATRQLELADARALIAASGFGPLGSAPDPRSHRTIGVELESFAVPTTDPGQLPPVELAAGSRLTFEPGGQVEVSSPPQRTVAAACESLSRDLAAVRATFSPLGVELVQAGMCAEPPPRLVDAPRYQAMEAYFATRWPEAGRAMMCATASVQVNLGLGNGARLARRWRAANVLGPVLAAAFSSSPVNGGTGCGRLAVWLALDPSRTAPIPCPVGDDPREAWIRFALDANVMLIRTAGGCQALVEEPITARRWIERGHDLGWPTADDVAYHLTTLFPPVRPRGWLELRMIDSLPDPWWRVPVAVAATLVDDGEAVAACEAVADRWWEAAEGGLADGPIAAAAAVCARRTLAGLRRVGVDMGTAVMVEQWAATVRKECDPPWAVSLAATGGRR